MFWIVSLPAVSLKFFWQMSKSGENCISCFVFFVCHSGGPNYSNFWSRLLLGYKNPPKFNIFFTFERTLFSLSVNGARQFQTISGELKFVCLLSEKATDWENMVREHVQIFCPISNQLSLSVIKFAEKYSYRG